MIPIYKPSPVAAKTPVPKLRGVLAGRAAMGVSFS